MSRNRSLSNHGSSAYSNTGTADSELPTNAGVAVLISDVTLPPSAVDPTQTVLSNALAAGMTYFNTASSKLRIYDGSAWNDATTTVEGVYDVTEFTGIATETTIAIVYDIGLVQVLLNGVQLANSDFTATTGTNIVLAVAVTNADDIITVIRWGAVTTSTFLGTAATKNTGVTTGTIPFAEDVVLIQPSGNVGIGTSSPAANLDVQGGAASTIRVGRTSAYNDTAVINLSGNRSYIKSEIISGTANGDTYLAFGTQGSGTVAEHLRIDSSGNFGIGTTSPATKLDVNGTVTATIASNADVLTLISTDADDNSGPKMSLTRNSASPADNDYVGLIAFKGNNSASASTRMGMIRTQVLDVTDGTEDSTLTFHSIHDGVETQRIATTATGIDVNGTVTADGLVVQSQTNNEDAVNFSRTTSTDTFGIRGDNAGVVEWRAGGSYGGGGVRLAGGLATSDGNQGGVSFHAGTGSGGFQSERLRIDSSGIVTTPYQPSFEVNLTGAVQNALGVYPDWAVSWDVGNNVSASTKKFTAPVTGVYHIDAWLCYLGVWTADRVIIYIQVNGTSRVSHQNYRSGNDTGSNLSCNLKLSAGDYVGIKVYQDSGQTQQLQAATQWAGMSGYLIG